MKIDDFRFKLFEDFLHLFLNLYLKEDISIKESLYVLKDFRIDPTKYVEYFNVIYEFKIKADYYKKGLKESIINSQNDKFRKLIRTIQEEISNDRGYANS